MTFAQDQREEMNRQGPVAGCACESNENVSVENGDMGERIDGTKEGTNMAGKKKKKPSASHGKKPNKGIKKNINNKKRNHIQPKQQQLPCVQAKPQQAKNPATRSPGQEDGEIFQLLSGRMSKESLKFLMSATALGYDPSRSSGSTATQQKQKQVDEPFAQAETTETTVNTDTETAEEKEEGLAENTERKSEVEEVEASENTAGDNDGISRSETALMAKEAEKRSAHPKATQAGKDDAMVFELYSSRLSSESLQFLMGINDIPQAEKAILDKQKAAEDERKNTSHYRPPMLPPAEKLKSTRAGKDDAMVFETFAGRLSAQSLQFLRMGVEGVTKAEQEQTTDAEEACTVATTITEETTPSPPTVAAVDIEKEGPERNADSHALGTTSSVSSSWCESSCAHSPDVAQDTSTTDAASSKATPNAIDALSPVTHKRPAFGKDLTEPEPPLSPRNSKRAPRTRTEKPSRSPRRQLEQKIEKVQQEPPLTPKKRSKKSVSFVATYFTKTKKAEIYCQTRHIDRIEDLAPISSYWTTRKEKQESVQHICTLANYYQSDQQDYSECLNRLHSCSERTLLREQEQHFRTLSHYGNGRGLEALIIQNSLKSHRSHIHSVLEAQHQSFCSADNATVRADRLRRTSLATSESCKRVARFIGRFDQLEATKALSTSWSRVANARSPRAPVRTDSFRHCSKKPNERRASA